MVSLGDANAYELRDYLHHKVIEGAQGDPFKSAFLRHLGLLKDSPPTSTVLSLYQRCAIAGLGELEEAVSSQDISRLLGQAAKIDGTPRAWVSDIFGVMAVRWLVNKVADDQLSREFANWISEFLPLQAGGGHLNLPEKDLVAYIGGKDSASYSSACVPLFLHYQNLTRIDDHLQRLSLIGRFMHEFRRQAHGDASTALLSLMLYVFEQTQMESAVVPPNGWALEDLLIYLERLPIGLKRWTWEHAGRTKGANPIRWRIENEYHIQNLLYMLLAPVFNDIADEVYLQPVGQKTPRIDLYLPSLNTIIEVKYRKDVKRSFQTLIGEIGEDASLYHADPVFKDARIVCFLWDNTRATQEHAKFKEGVLKMGGISGCVVISTPSTILD